jgi:hypothetical protein
MKFSINEIRVKGKSLIDNALFEPSRCFWDAPFELGACLRNKKKFQKEKKHVILLFHPRTGASLSDLLNIFAGSFRNLAYVISGTEFALIG